MSSKYLYTNFSRLRRKYDEDDFIDCLILKENDSFIITGNVNEAMMHDGYSIILKNSITSIEKISNNFSNYFIKEIDFNSNFIQEIPLDNWKSILIYISYLREVACFIFEEDAADEIYVGYIVDIKSDTFLCKCITPEGDRYDDIDYYDILSCTKVDLRSLYAKNFQNFDQHLHGGPPELLLKNTKFISFNDFNKRKR